ncbi:MAG: ADP-ribosylglycohydrolase family protein [Planctomycetota bacterium]
MIDGPENADRIAGALAVSALGDAIGLPHEARGLRGEVAEDANTCDPFDLPVADDFRGEHGDPWNIWPTASLTAGMRGVVSDDTAIRIDLIEPWLNDAFGRGLSLNQLTEHDWLDWLTNRRMPDAEPWREAMVGEHARQWPAMYALADGDQPSCGDGPCFFRPGVPTCFGYFLFAELAPLFADRPTTEVFDRFHACCRLDQDSAKVMTGVVACLTCEAANFESPAPSLPEIWDNVLSELVQASRLDASLLHDVFLQPGSIGERAKHRSRHEFLAKTQREIYNHPTLAPTHDLKPFDPILQLAQLSAYVGYAGDDPWLALKLAALGPGDTDTLAATLGLIIGASLGRQACLASDAGHAITAVEAATAELFGVTPKSRTETIRRFLGPGVRWG